jgi:hypothetical protein
MIVLRTLEGAPKWALRDFLRDDASTDDDTESVSTFREARCVEHRGKRCAYSLSLADASPSSCVLFESAEIVLVSELWCWSMSLILVLMKLLRSAKCDHVV